MFRYALVGLLSWSPGLHANPPGLRADPFVASGALASQTDQGHTAHAEQAKAPKPAQLAKKKPVGGKRGFELVSSVNYTDVEGLPHELRFSCVHPDRCRLWVSYRDVNGNSLRNLLYRYGDQSFNLFTGQDSVRMEGEYHTATVRLFEVRRALFVYPNGFDWQGEGNTRRVQVNKELQLKAHLGEDGKLVRIDSFGPNGQLQENFREVTWDPRTTSATSPPKVQSFDFFFGERSIWSEKIESLSFETRSLDVFFLPPDRRGYEKSKAKQASTNQANARLRVESADWSGGWEYLVKSPHEDLSQATEWIRHLREELAVREGWALDDTVGLVITPEGSVKAGRLSLRPGASPIGSGWARGQHGPALAIWPIALEQGTEAWTGEVESAVRRNLPRGLHMGQRLLLLAKPGSPPRPGTGPGAQMMVSLKDTP